ncbi:hypothetical protein ACP70R_021156 [Stipagrostis hirtigluma subsp. patula]
MPAAAAAAAAVAPRAGLLPLSQDERREEDGPEESEEEVESDDDVDDGEGGGGSEAGSLADLCEPDAGSDEDPTFDPDADGDLEVEAVLRSRMSRMSISASARKGRKGSAVPKMGKEETDLLSLVDKLMQDRQLEKLKVYECKAYLRMHKLRLTGKKEVLLNRIKEYIEVKTAGEVKYPVSSFVLNCKGDACKGDVVMFEQNIYKRKKGAPRGVKRLCGQRTNAGRIIKESYGTEKQQHTFTIEIFWSKGYKPWPPLHPLLIKGRNLYKDKTMRQPWPDEEERKRVLQEKHARGFVARKKRAVRIHVKEVEKAVRLNRMKEHKINQQQNMNPKSSQEVHPQYKVESVNTVLQRTDERKGPSLQNGGSDITRLQHISLKTAPTHTQHNEVLPQKGVTRTLKQELIDHHGGSQQQIFSKPTTTQQLFKNMHQQPHIQHQCEVPPQERATRISSKEFTDRQISSQHNGGSGDTRQHQISSKPAPKELLKYPQQPPKYQDYNEAFPRDSVKSTYKEESSDHQNNSYHATKYDEPAYQPRGKFTQHQHVNAYQARGKFTQHANEYQRGSSCHQNVRANANHQAPEPLRSRNPDFNSRDQFYGQDYGYQDYQEDRRTFSGHYHPGPNWHQNYGRRQMTQDDPYHTQQNHNQNYGYHRRMNQQQFRTWPSQPQWFPAQRSQLQPCNFYYKNGWCRYGENCRYSHDF